jgi:hypothetical protein
MKREQNTTYTLVVNPFREWLIIAPLVLLSNVKSIWISKPVKSGMRPPPHPTKRPVGQYLIINKSWVVELAAH